MREFMALRKLDPSRLIAMDDFTQSHPIEIELAYASANNFMGVPVYRPEARLWLYDDVARAVLRAALICHERYGYRMRLYDGLRTVEAQEAMRNTEVVRNNSQWLEGTTRLLSSPGKGGHPRGMAIDLTLVTTDGVLLPMGTAFDELNPNGAGPDVNKAHRDYRPLDPAVIHNRKILEEVIAEAGSKLGVPLKPLPSEWWDFRLPSEIYEQYAPLADADLPPAMRMAEAGD